MKLLRANRIAAITALAGVTLMVFTILWRINPFEGSVVPRFLTDNPIGIGVFWVLFVACMPAWIVSITLCRLLPLPERAQWLLACCSMLVLQCITWFLIGKLISLCVRKISGGRSRASSTGVKADDPGQP